MPADDIGKLKLDRTALASGGRRRGRRALLVTILVILVGVAVVVRLFSAAAIEIETATVSLQYPSSGFTLLNASGYVVAQRKAALAAKATGRLEWLGVEEGSRVRRGEVIARLEAMDIDALRLQTAAALLSVKAQRDQAKVETVDATTNRNRVKELFMQGVLSQADYDVAEFRFQRANAALAAADANVKASEAALRSADVSVDYTRIKAPFDGVVLTKSADVGDIVTPLGAAANAKASVVTLADLSSLKVEVDVSEANIEKVRRGQPCEILLDALPQKRFRGLVHSVVPTADRSKATVMVKVGFVELDPRILPEMSAKVAFLERPVTVGEELPKTVVPRKAVVTRAGIAVVYLVKGDRLVETKIATAEMSGDQIEIRSGVNPGDKIALQPLEKLKNGSRVKIITK